MSDDLEIALASERLDEGTPEEKACFGQFRVRFRESELLAGVDYYTNGYRAGPRCRHTMPANGSPGIAGAPTTCRRSAKATHGRT